MARRRVCDQRRPSPSRPPCSLSRRMLTRFLCSRRAPCMACRSRSRTRSTSRASKWTCATSAGSDASPRRTPLSSTASSSKAPSCTATPTCRKPLGQGRRSAISTAAPSTRTTARFRREVRRAARAHSSPCAARSSASAQTSAARSGVLPLSVLSHRAVRTLTSLTSSKNPLRLQRTVRTASLVQPHAVRRLVQFDGGLRGGSLGPRPDDGQR